MAVLDGLPGLEVFVCIDGQPIQEYNDDEEEEVAQTPVAEYQAAKTVSKFVESISDKEFSIQIARGLRLLWVVRPSYALFISMGNGALSQWCQIRIIPSTYNSLV